MNNETQNQDQPGKTYVRDVMVTLEEDTLQDVLREHEAELDKLGVAEVQADPERAPAARQARIVVTLVKSPIGYNEKQRRTIRALGLRKINASVVKPDTPSVRGMIDKVQHLVRVDEI